MNIWENAVLTDKGIALLAKLIAGETLHITRGVTGSGYDTPGLLVKKESVTSPMQQIYFRETSYTEAGECALKCYITNVGLNVAYTATQIGIYATDPDEGEILFFITQAPSGKGEEVPSESEMPGYSSEWTFYFKYGRAGNVSINVDPSNTVSVEMFNEGMGKKANASTEIKNTDIAYAKIVPSETAPYAKVKKIGGMSYRDETAGVLKNAAVTRVKTTGKNLLKFSKAAAVKRNGITFTKNDDGSVSVTGTATNTANFAVTKMKALVFPTGEYYVSIGSSTTRVYVDAYSGGAWKKTLRWNNGVLSIDSTTYDEIEVCLSVDKDTEVNESVFPIIIFGSVAQPFEPYKETTLPIPAEVSPANGINNRVYDYIGWENGVKKSVKCVGMVDLGTLNWNYVNLNGHSLFWYQQGDVKPAGASLCLKYDSCEILSDFLNTNKTVYLGNVNAAKSINVMDDDYTDVTTFKSAMSGVILYYELEIPIVTDISDLLSDDNFIEVSEGGLVIAENENGLDVPSEIIFYKGKNKSVGAEQFVGDLLGKASRAVSDKNGNPIHESYAPAAFVSEAIYISNAGDTMAGLKQIYAKMKDQSSKVVIINHVVSDSLPLGGVWHAMIHKTSNDYGVITAITYNLGMSCKLAISNGTWGNWKVTSKVSGSYTGNSSAAERKINIGASTSMLLITSDNGMALVSGRGAICKPRLDDTVHGLPSYQCMFKDGILTIASADATVNGSGTYWYDTL